MNIFGRHTTLFCTLLALTLFWSCSGSPTDAERALSLVGESRTLVQQDRLNLAKIYLDSVHSTYPKCVAERRLAKDLQDSIVYLEAKRTLAYSDSLLQILQPQVDPLLKRFRYEKDERYEDHGKYVHRLLTTGSNTSRCFLQTYATDDYRATLKSYYFGSRKLAQNTVILEAGGEECRHSGTDHSFEAGGWHSILSFEDDQALEILNFISAHQTDRIRINLLGTDAKDAETNYVYYLQDSEKTALQDTYQLILLIADIHQLEEAFRIAGLQIEKYEKKHNML